MTRLTRRFAFLAALLIAVGKEVQKSSGMS
jgi:hypothetical protein